MLVQSAQRYTVCTKSNITCYLIFQISLELRKNVWFLKGNNNKNCYMLTADTTVTAILK